MNLAVFAGWAAKVVVVLLSLLNTRMLIDLVGIEGLAVQSIIVSLTVWFALLNFGIPTAVQNLVSKYRAKGADYETVKNTAYTILIILFLLLLPVVLSAGLIVRYWLLSNYEFVSVQSVLIACTLMFISGLGLLFSQILYAEHRGIWANIYPAINAICVFAGLATLGWLGFTNFNIVLVVFLLPSLLIFCLGAFQIRAFRVWNLDVKIAREIWRDSKGLLLFATLSAATLAVDYFIMSRLLQPYDIAQYNLASRIFITILSIHGVLLVTTWPVISELLHRKQLSEARKKLALTLQQGLVFMVVAGGGLVMTMDWIIPILSGNKITDVPLYLSLSLFIYTMLRIWSDTFAMGLLCIGKTGPINLYIPFQAGISLIGQYVFANMFGVIGIVFGLIVSFVLTAAWILPWQFFKITKKNEYV